MFLGCWVESWLGLHLHTLLSLLYSVSGYVFVQYEPTKTFYYEKALIEDGLRRITSVFPGGFCRGVTDQSMGSVKRNPSA